MKETSVALLSLFAILVAGCGVPSRERFGPVSTCRLDNPIPINAVTLAGITLADLAFHQSITTKAVKDSAPQDMTFYPVTIGGTVQDKILGFYVQPSASGAGILPAYGETLAAPVEDEEGFMHYYPFRRDISGRLREEGTTRSFVTRIAEKPSDILSQKAIATSLRVVVEDRKLAVVEINWPITDRDDWREGEHKLPRLGTWEWPSHAGSNEAICLKSATLKTR